MHVWCVCVCVCVCQTLQCVCVCMCVCVSADLSALRASHTHTAFPVTLWIHFADFFWYLFIYLFQPERSINTEPRSGSADSYKPEH